MLMRSKSGRFLSILLAVIISVSLVSPAAMVQAMPEVQENTPNYLARAAMAKMTPAQKVGQLFIVTFKGSSVGEGSQVYQLIQEYHIGGVILSAENDNFTGAETTIADVVILNQQLQQTAWNSSEMTLNDPVTKATYKPVYIPLFIGISQEGDGYPYDQILNGLTSLPDEMAIGATWKSDFARATGNVLGKELSSLGFNLLLGPSVDVLDVIKPEGGEDLGTRTFGGDPFWVGEMGKNYIQGIHEGSEGKIAVISKHFPGSGGSDRPPEDEIATVRKSLEQLKQIELAPFFSITGNSPSKEMSTDGLLVSHIRYQGFQGNIRATTRPVSFDPAALQQLMDLPQFSSWRQKGGIVMSDNLGSPAVRKFYDPKGIVFDGKQVARNAFLAGSDILYLDNFITSGDPDSFTTISQTLENFNQKYREDTAFAQRVDASVERLLTLKYQLYPEFTLGSVLPKEDALNNIGKSQQVVFEIGQRAVTLLSPEANDLVSSLPEPPQSRDRIVFLTDVDLGRQCSTCELQGSLKVDALQNAVLRLYGPQAAGQVFQYRLSSYSFQDLLKFLDNSPDQQSLENDLQSANWVVFATQKLDQTRPESMALKRLLSERAEILSEKKVIVFSFNAPYYLDATDISKLTAYYGLYSKVTPFIDVAARVLFQELTPTGASPVSVPGLGYDLITATSPDPTQMIPIFLDVSALVIPEPTLLAATQTPEAMPPVKFRVGDTIPLMTGEIYDHNHNIVPDGTVVRFSFTTGGEGGVTQQTETTTVSGVAKTSFRIVNQGLLEIRASSDPALISELLQLDVSSTEAAAITSVAPTLQITEPPAATFTPVVKTPEEEGENPNLQKIPNVGNWVFSSLLVWLTAAGIYWITRKRIGHRWSIRWALLAGLGGLIFYIILAAGVVPDFTWNGLGGVLSQALITLTGMAAGWAIGYYWRKRETGAAHQTNTGLDRG